MRRTALVLTHDPKIHLGNLEPVLVERGYEIEIVDIPRADVASLDPAAADIVIVLGGEEGVYERDALPYLRDEIALIQGRIALEQPILGVCLGAQLMAQSLGSEVYRGPLNDIGFRSVATTTAGDASPVRHFRGVPVLEWHSDTFPLPAGVTRLAGSDAYANEAFSIDDWALAVQFHPEVTPEMHERWLVDSTADVERAGLDPEALRRDRELHTEAMRRASRLMLEEWLDGVEASADAAVAATAAAVRAGASNPAEPTDDAADPGRTPSAAQPLPAA